MKRRGSLGASLLIRLLASPRSRDFVGIMSRSVHARDAYPGISYHLWRSSRIHRTLVTFVTLVLGGEDCEFKPQLVQHFHLRNLPKLFTKVQSHARCPQLETQDNSPDGGATASL